MKRASVATFLWPIALIVLLSLAMEGNAKTNIQHSREYTCGEYEQISVYDMQKPIVAYIDTIGRWATFERGEVRLDQDVRYYFTWDGLDWTFNFLPFVGNLIETPYEYELWAETQIPELGTNIAGAFNQGYLAPNCWSQESLTTYRTVSPSGVHNLPPPGIVGDF